MKKTKLAKLTSKNQITLPKEIVDQYPETSYFEVRDVGAGILLEPVHVGSQSQRQTALKHLEALREQTAKAGITEQDIADAVKWARENPRP
jgi:hypothetical protein